MGTLDIEETTRRPRGRRLLAALVLCWMVAGASACGGGGGSEQVAGDVPAPTPTPADPAEDPLDLDGRLTWDGPAVAEVGLPFEATLTPGDAVSMLLPARLGVAPEGVELDAGTLTLRWTPVAGQEGAQTIEVVRDLGEPPFGETLRETFTVQVAARPRVASQQIRGTVGGKLQTGSGASRLPGAVLDVPAGALAADATVGLYDLTGHPLLPGQATVIEVLPSWRLAKKATLTLPYSEGFLASLEVTDERLLAIHGLDEATDRWVALPSTVDTARNLVTAQTSQFSRYVVWVTTMDAIGSRLRNGLLSALNPWKVGVRIVEGAYELHLRLLEVRRLLTQPRRILPVGGLGGPSDGSATYALVVHGLLSDHHEMSQLIAYASGKYDHVFAYEYPSGGDIADNARWLTLNLRRHLPEHARITVFAHSMGGLVSRYMIEQFRGLLWAQNMDVVNAVFLGTPHTGADLAPLGAFLDDTLDAVFEVVAGLPRLREGIAQLHPTHPHFVELNASPNQAWTNYWLIGGVLPPTDSDEWVGTSSSMARLFDPQRTRYRMYPGLGHSDLHLSIATNGIGAELDRYVERQWHGKADAPADGVGIVDAQVKVALRQVQVSGQARLEYASAEADVNLDLGDFRLTPGMLVMAFMKPDADACGGHPGLGWSNWYDAPGSGGDPVAGWSEHFESLPADQRIHLGRLETFETGDYRLCEGSTAADLPPWKLEVQILNLNALGGVFLAWWFGLPEPAFELYQYTAYVEAERR